MAMLHSGLARSAGCRLVPRLVRSGSDSGRQRAVGSVIDSWLYRRHPFVVPSTTSATSRTLSKNRFHHQQSSSTPTSSTTSSTSSNTRTMSTFQSLAEEACQFLTASPDPFHAVANVQTNLERAGFERLTCRQPFTGMIQPGGKYYYTLQGSTLVAFCVGPKVMVSSSSSSSSSTTQPSFGFHILGGHTDSPNLKVKPYSQKRHPSSGCTMLAVECYGGGLWHTWFDRDLSISGRVLVRSTPPTTTPTTTATSANPSQRLPPPSPTAALLTSRLVNLQEPVARVSTLCIHLQTSEERDAFKVNKETHTAPIVGTEPLSTTNITAQQMLQDTVTEQLNSNNQQQQQQKHPMTNTLNGTSWKEKQEPLLLQAIANQIEVPIDDIIDWELNLYDTQPATIGGLSKEFLYSARLDNLATVFCAMTSLIDYSKTMPEDASDVSMMVIFDHEEVGSESAVGAGSPVMKEAVQRIAAALMGTNPSNTNADTNTNTNIISPDAYAACLQKSFILSVDQAHAIHPNYAHKHESNHAPHLNKGVVIKTNSNQRYTTNGRTGFVVRELGRRANIPIQEFVVRNDCPCGSTIGPILSANTGIRTVDVGMPQLSMHSCREVMGIADCKFSLDLSSSFSSSIYEAGPPLKKDLEEYVSHWCLWTLSLSHTHTHTLTQSVSLNSNLWCGIIQNLLSSISILG